MARFEYLIESTEWMFGHHRSLLALDSIAGQRSVAIELGSPPTCIRRLAEVVTVDHVRFAEPGPALR